MKEKGFWGIGVLMVEESKDPKKIKPEELISRFRSKEDLYKYLT